MSDKERRKKDREQFFLEQFLKHAGITPTSITPSEKPDFLITLDGRKVGVEVTEIFVQGGEWKPHPQLTKELPLRAIETYTDAISSQALKTLFRG